MIEVLRDEAIRLIDIETHLIRRMMQSPRLLTASNVGEAQTMDADSAPMRIEVLEGEKTKLADLELVLAVVGTMKAGKSTTINAIVGTEVLPNRNRPMTALPTLIRHASGQIEPRLIFKNAQPIERLLVELRQALKSPANKALRVKCLSDSGDVSQLIALIERGDTFQSSYQGAEEIFEFLRSLNDLVRLSSDLSVTFPFDQYAQIGELPVIEVEFAHLREAPQSTGRLTLLDTPGPNESGQPHLKKMLREQLAKASAILAVLDFTQLKSDADAQVRLELLDLAKVTENRLYVLVNKFDQKDRNSDDHRTVQSFVANTLLDGQITADNVFPVSSKLAYLANRARHALRLQDVLPDHAKHAWVADFGKEAFGGRWESFINDRDEVINSAETLWENSLFAAPLEKVIRAAHARAAIFAVESAAAKLLDTAEVIESLLSVRNTALKKSTSELKQQIDALQKQLSDIDDLEKKASSESTEHLKELAAQTEKLSAMLKESISNEIEKYFKEGKRLEKSAAEKQRKTELEASNKQPSVFEKLFAGLSDNKNTNTRNDGNLDFDPENPVITFNEREKALSLRSAITESLSAIYTDADKKLKISISEMLEKFNSNFQKNIVEQTDKMLVDLTGNLEGHGFSVKVKAPETSVLKLELHGEEILDTIIAEKQRTVTRSRRQSGAWGTFCGWFGTSDWGWEDYSDTETVFEVDTKKIKDTAIKDAQKSIAGLGQSIEQFIKEPMNKGIKDFFGQLTETIERLRGDFSQSIRDKELSRKEQDELESEIKSIQKDIPGVITDINGLRTDILHNSGNMS
jgi:GTPase SAR1 family protein